VEDSKMIHLAPCAFVPISIFSGTALIGAIISAWISYAAKPVRHPAPRRSAEILRFPRQKITL
jgi:hypothetical protein